MKLERLNRWLIRKGLKRCRHTNINNYKNTWELQDGTPMYEFRCYDCGWHDKGHVHGNFEQNRPNQDKNRCPLCNVLGWVDSHELWKDKKFCRACKSWF